MAYENQPKSEYETINDDTQHCLKEPTPHAPDYLELLSDGDCATKGKTGHVSDQMQFQYDEKNEPIILFMILSKAFLIFQISFSLMGLSWCFGETLGYTNLNDKDHIQQPAIEIYRGKIVCVSTHETT